jgi:hypothetical protein
MTARPWTSTDDATLRECYALGLGGTGAAVALKRSAPACIQRHRILTSRNIGIDRAAERESIEARRVSRDVCFLCGTRGDLPSPRCRGQHVREAA